MQWVEDDGGRRAAGFRAIDGVGDCVVRAITIATQLPYRTVYDSLNDVGRTERIGIKSRPYASSARNGVWRSTYEKFLLGLGWRWTPTMGIGTGCRVHLRDGEIPMHGRLIVCLSRHLTAVIDGVIHDRYDPSRDGNRCCYGYYQEPIEQVQL